MDNEVRVSWTRAELEEATRRYMLGMEGIPKNMPPEQRERWHTNLGLLTNFVNCLWTNTFE